MARKVNVSYESLRQEGREEVLEWMKEQGILNYSTPENKYFYWSPTNEWLVFIPWQKSDK